MRFKGQIWIERNLFLFAFFFFFWSNAEKNFSRDDDDDDIIIIIKILQYQKRRFYISLFSLSLSFNYLVPISAGIARVVKVKLARAQGVHDDVEDTELTGG